MLRRLGNLAAAALRPRLSARNVLPRRYPSTARYAGGPPSPCTLCEHREELVHSNAFLQAYLTQRPVQIVDHVVRVLKPHADAQHVLGHAHFGADFRRQAGMGG